ncbi:MAG: hypothetical protein SNG35_00820 [Rikenellaceae bacterium]
MPLLLLIFGAFSSTFFAVLVGIIGSRRRIGFGLSFLLSIVFTPLIGFIITLFSDPVPQYAESNWGCLATLFGILGLLLLIPIILFLIGITLPFLVL